MSAKTRSSVAVQRRAYASVFSALGDDRRLALIARLASGLPCSISELTRGSRVTRQAISKHLRVLETAGIVRSVRHGREQRFEFRPHPIGEAKRYLDFVSAQWDEALGQLKSFVEK